MTSMGRIALAVSLSGALLGAGWLVLRPASVPPVASTAPEQAPAPRAGAPAATAAPAAAPPATAQPDPAGEAPRFDVARIGASGMLVAAGRAAPNAEVVLMDGAQELGRARADGRGEWVILPNEALAAGARELSLQSRRPGGEVVAGREVVLLVVPEATPGKRPGSEDGARRESAMAVLLPAPGARGAEPRLLQGPPEAAGGSRGNRLGLDIVDYEEGGAIRFAGTAPPGSTVRLYVDSEHIGDAVSSAAGRWQLTPATQPAAGRHMLRVDQLTAKGGAVAARVEVPFLRERMGEGARETAEGLVVQPGQSLWRIARGIYGRGNRYTVIYDANRDQIRDPRLIYPGQVFAMPGGSAPAESSLSR